MAETSTKPYLIRAIHEWCTDNGYTPYVAVAVDQRTTVPMEHVRNGEIVLNVSPLATNHLHLGNDLIEFQARFGGVPRELSIPVENVTAIYARENGHGMAFDVPKAPAVDAPPADDASSAAGQAKKDAEPGRTIAETVLASVPSSTAAPPATPGAKPPQLVSVGNDSPSNGKNKADPSASGDDPERPDPSPPGKPRQSRPKLTRIK